MSFVRGSPAALLVIAEHRGQRLALPTVRVEPIGWQQRYGRTVGWSFAAGASASAERALFCVTALDAKPSDLGVRSALTAGHDVSSRTEIVSLVS
jgi:hypothetical protein